jgi:hypothetical protein
MSRLPVAELEHEHARLLRVARAYEGTPKAQAYARKAEIAKWKLELARGEQGGTDHDSKQFSGAGVHVRRRQGG